jgi:membrane fusion protein (multidrug efflux system)
MIETPPDPSGHHESETTLLARMLYEEQTRLRAELEDLRRKQQELAESKQQGKGDGDQDQKDQDKKDQGSKDEDNEDQQEEGAKEQQKEQGDKKDKPPVLQRLRIWVRAHPVAVILILVGLIVLIIASVLLWHYLESYENTDDAFVDGHTDPISSRIAGFVSVVYVENTYHVKKGQLLLELDPRDYLVAKEQAAASLAQAQASVRAQTPNVPITATTQNTQVINAQLSVASATANLTAAEAKYQSAVADQHQAEAGQANALREEQRYQQLVARQEVSREQYDQRATEAKTQTEMVAARRQTADAAAKAVTQAEAQLHQAEQQVDEAQKNMPRQVAVQNQTLAIRLAELKAEQARADQADLNFQYTRIYAPADGIIGDRSVQIGMQVQPGQELLALTESNDIWVTANFKETQVRRMRAGQSVTIHVDALKQDFNGYVEALPGGTGAIYSLLPPENATGNYVKVVQRLPVRIHIRAGQRGFERLAPGMSVEPKVWLR